MQGMNMTRWGLLAGGLALGVGLGSLGMNWLSMGQAQDSEIPLEPVIATPQPYVGALGRIEPAGEVINISGPPGERIGELLVGKGDWVTAGDALIRLETYDERLAERNYATSQLQEAKQRLAAETRYAETQIQEARTRVNQVDQPRALEIEAQAATVRQIQAELEDAETDLARFATLYAEGAIAQQDLQKSELQVQQKQEALSNAQATLRRLQQTRTADLDNATQQVETAEANLDLARSQIQVESLARNLELAEARLERSLIRAPREGQILQILAYPGEAIESETGILQLGNTQEMMVVAEIYETDITRIQVGQAADISSQALPQQLKGTVEQIGLQINKKDVLDEDPAADVDARIVEVDIRLDPESSQKVAGLTNLQVDVSISTQGS
jgi:HlyD family secretion protein